MRQWFTLFEIASHEKLLPLTTEERRGLNDDMSNRSEAVDGFLSDLARGRAFTPISTWQS